jgi:hypothetical protein
MVRAALVTLCAWLILAFAPASGKERPLEKGCRGDRGVDRCADVQRRLRELYGVKAIEAHLGADDQVRRAYYVDGNGRDLVHIAFVRAAGRDPTVWVHFPRRPGVAALEPLQAPVPKAAWDHVLDRSSLFDRTLAPLERVQADGFITICLHGWGYAIEATDPPEPGSGSGRPPPRRAIGNSCDDDLVADYATELARSAVALFPACMALDPQHYRNDASRLAACGMLSGDRIAAADVLNSANALREPRDPEDEPVLSALFSDDAVIDWDGSVIRGAPGPARTWLARLKTTRARYFYAESVEGLSSRRVRLLGKLARAQQGVEDGSMERASVEQIWVFTPEHDYRVESVKVGPFEPAP